MNITLQPLEALALRSSACEIEPVDFHGAIEAAGLDFLDALVGERPEALEWIASEAYESLDEGAIELCVR